MMMLTVGASLAYQTGDDLWRDCNGGNEQRCMGYVIGAVDSIVMMDEVYHMPHHFCIDQTVRAGQVRDAVIAYLTAHPEQRRLNASSIVWTAMGYAYPCSKA
jgi:hypothetical protein